jgi:hypothetical protein
MTAATVQSIVELLAASSDDEHTMSLPGLKDRGFGFHAQQAAEKLLKVLIAGHGHRYRHTHNLGELMRTVAALGEQVPFDAGLSDHLTKYAVVWRYQVADKIPLAQRTSIERAISDLRTVVSSAYWFCIRRSIG